MIITGFISKSNLRKNKLSEQIEDVFQKNAIINVESYLNNTIALYTGKFTEHDQDSLTIENDHLVLGRAFQKGNNKPLSNKVLKNMDPQKIEHGIWGKFLYLKHDLANQSVSIFRDPTGQLPFFYYELDNQNLVFSSDISILLEVLSIKPQYNWNYLSTFILHSELYANGTPFTNILELLPGCKLTIKKDRSTVSHWWNPLESKKNHCTNEEIIDSIHQVLQAWLGPYKKIILSLSGGLDSSSLLFFLHKLKKNKDLSAINFFHDKVRTSNELFYARKLCKKLNVPLQEINTAEYLPFFCDNSKYLRLKPNKPSTALFNPSQSEAIFKLLSQPVPSIFISGHGGDHVFMCPPTKRSIIDYLHERGISGLYKKICDLAAYYRKPILHILKPNLKYFFSGLYSKKLAVNPESQAPWFNKKLYNFSSKSYTHPFYNQNSFKQNPGKFDQLTAILDAFSTICIDPFDQTNPTFYPLMYTPIVECALTIPTYNLYEQGFDRYPLRKSVSDYFNTDAVWRRDKGETSGIIQLAIKKNMDRILSLCLEGVFSKNNFVNKELLHQHIINVAHGSTDYLWPLLNLLSVEIFLEYWE